MTTNKTTTVATTNTEPVPAYLADRQGAARGSEQAGVDDIVMPRILLIQQLSPQLDPSDEKYVEGCVAGDIVNSLTGMNYGTTLKFVPVYFRKEYIIWKDRTKGGGFCGSFSSRQAAAQALSTLEPPLTDYNVEDTATQFVMIMNDDGSVDQAVLSMSRTKLMCSRKLQALIRLAECDSFAKSYKLVSVAAKSDMGKYFNISVKSAGFVQEEVYYAAETVYESIRGNDDRYKVHDVTEEVVDGGDKAQSF